LWGRLAQPPTGPAFATSSCQAWRRPAIRPVPAGLWDASGTSRAAASAARGKGDDNPYEVLGVARDASAEDVKASYRRLALKWHPDRNPDNQAEAEAQFKRVSKAYSLLSDPEQRAMFDRFGAAGLGGGGGPGAGAQAQNFTEEQAEMIFRQMFGDKPLHEIIREVEQAVEVQQRQMNQREAELRREAQLLQQEASELRMRALRAASPRQALDLRRLAAAKAEQATRAEHVLQATVVQHVEQGLRARMAVSQLRTLDPTVKAKNRLRVGFALGAAVGCYFVLGYSFVSSVCIFLFASLFARIAFALLGR